MIFSIIFWTFLANTIELDLTYLDTLKANKRSAIWVFVGFFMVTFFKSFSVMLVESDSWISILFFNDFISISFFLTLKLLMSNNLIFGFIFIMSMHSLSKAGAAMTSTNC